MAQVALEIDVLEVRPSGGFRFGRENSSPRRGLVVQVCAHVDVHKSAQADTVEQGAGGVVFRGGDDLVTEAAATENPAAQIRSRTVRFIAIGFQIFPLEEVQQTLTGEVVHDLNQAVRVGATLRTKSLV